MFFHVKQDRLQIYRRISTCNYTPIKYITMSRIREYKGNTKRCSRYLIYSESTNVIWSPEAETNAGTMIRNVNVK